VIDTELSELLPINYEWISPLQNGRMKVKKNGRWGYADEQFRIRIPTVYTDGTDFRDSRLTEVTQDEKKGIIDPDGFEVIPPRYSDVRNTYPSGRTANWVLWITISISYTMPAWMLEDHFTMDWHG